MMGAVKSWVACHEMGDDSSNLLDQTKYKLFVMEGKYYMTMARGNAKTGASLPR